MESSRLLKIVTWTVGALTTALALFGVWLAIIEPHKPGSPGAGGVGLAVYEAIVYTAMGLLGAIVATFQPRNPVGRLLQLIPLALAIGAVCNHLYFQSLLGDGDLSGVASYAAWVVSWLWIFAIVPAFTIFPLLFPTGRPLTPRLRPLVWIAVVAAAVTWFGTAFVPGPLDENPAVVNPLGIEGAPIEIIGIVGFVVLVPTALASIASIVARFRRSTGTERQQLKWVATASALLPVAFAGAGLSSEVDAGIDLGYVLLIGALLIVAVAVAVAMLRYRLYDIDIVINRTLVYGALTATLAAAYVGGVLLLQFVLSPLTQRSELAVAGSTLAVAALFRPARAQIQGWVDRRFYRSRYDATRTLETFAAGLRDELDLAALARELRGVVTSAMQPTHVSLWMREG